jgi:hypothetical protein
MTIVEIKQLTDNELRSIVEDLAIQECRATMSKEAFEEFMDFHTDYAWWYDATIDELQEYLLDNA